MSALPLEAEFFSPYEHVRFVQQADLATLDSISFRITHPRLLSM